MTNYGIITEGSARTLARTIGKVRDLVPSLVTTIPESASDVMLIPVRVSDGTDGTYSGLEQTWDGTANSWSDTDGGIEWGTSTDIGSIIEMNKRTGLDGSVFLASYFGDTTEQIMWAFFAGVIGPGEYIDFKHYIDSTTGKMFFNDGTVFVGEETGTVVTDNGTGYSLGSDLVYWVETVTPYQSQTTTVNSLIQSGTMDQFISDDGTNVTTKTALVDVVSGVPYPMHEGDIYIEGLFTPSFHADVKGADNEARHLLHKSKNSSSNSLDGYFLEGRVTSIKTLAGEMWDQTDIEAFQFGGVVDNTAIDYVSGIDTSTADKITFSMQTLTPDIVNGLVELWDNASAAAEVIESIDWIGIETGGVFYHKNSPVDSTASDDHWQCFGWDGTNMTVDGTAKTSLEICVDRKGHIWEIDGSSQPPDSTNYRYQHCSDPATFPDIILDTSQANTTIAVSNECYYEVGTTDGNPTDPAPTIQGTFSTCASCESGGTNELWKDCTTDASLAVLSASYLDVDFAWLCNGGTLKRAYNSGITFDSTTNPTYLKQCGTTPVDCTDLVGWLPDDDFGGTGCNSGSIGDINNSIIWTDTDGKASIAANQLILTNTAGGSADYANNATLPAHTMTVQVDVVTTSGPAASPTGGASVQAALYIIFTNGHFIVCRFYWDVSGKIFQVISGTPGGTVLYSESATTPFSGTIKMSVVQNGSNINVLCYLGGVLKYTWLNRALTPSIIGINANTATSTGWVVTYDNFVTTGINRIDPTGNACT